MSEPLPKDPIDAAAQLLRQFLEGMPELAISPDYPLEQRLVNGCYDGDVCRYVQDSFEQYLMAEYDVDSDPGDAPT